MAEQTIREVSEATGISRFTLQQVAKKGTIPAHQSGATWLIDTESETFQKWLEAHWQQPRVKGKQMAETIRAETPEPPNWLTAYGKQLYRKDLKFRIDCEQYGHDSTWRRMLNKKAERLANVE